MEESRMFHQDTLILLGMGQRVRSALNREPATDLEMRLGTGYEEEEGDQRSEPWLY